MSKKMIKKQKKQKNNSLGLSGYSIIEQAFSFKFLDLDLVFISK